MKDPKNYFVCAKRLVIFLLLVSAGNNLFSQTTVTSPPGVNTFQRNFSLAPSEFIYEMEQTSDSGFIAVGQLIDNPSLSFDTYVTKTDKYGNTQWAKSVGASGFNIERAFDVHQTTDGGYIVSGGSSANGGDMYLYKLDATGNLSWIQSFGNFFLANSTEFDAHVVQTNDGGYMLTASTDSNNVSPYYTLLVIVKVDAAGVLQWEKSYHNFNTSSFQSGGAIIKTTDGNYAIMGTTNTGSGGSNLLLFKIDPNGDTIWTRTYDLGAGEVPTEIRQTGDGGFIFGGIMNDASFLLKVDSLGNAQWSKHYDNLSNMESAYVLDAVSDGGYMFGGYTGDQPGNWNFFMIKTDSAGNVLWGKRYGILPNHPGVAWGGQETNDRGFVLGGYSGMIGDPTNIDMSFVKTDSLGNSGCDESPYPVVTTVLPIITTNAPYHKYSTNVSAIPIANVTPLTPVDINVCCHVPLTITGNDTVCIGSSVTLTAAGAYSYLWNTGATTQSITVTANTDTAFTVQGFSGPSFTCQSLTFNIAAITVTPVITGNTTICDGSSTTLTASGGNVFQWSNNATTSSITVSPSADSTYSVIVTIGSCADTTSTMVTVNPTPVATLNSVDSLCTGQSATLFAGGGGTYLWNTSDTTSSITISPSATTNYYVVVSNGLCTDTAFQTVIVNQSPTAAITGNTSICSGDNTTLTASGGGSYQWNTGPTSTAITVTPSTNTTYSVIVTNNSGCSDTATAQVIVNPIPVAAINGSTTICTGSSTNLTASGGTIYSWSTGASTALISVTPSVTTTYSVIVSSGTCADTAYHTVSLLPVPVASVSANDTILIGGSTQISATGGGTYSWSPSSGLSCSTCQNPVADPLQTTTYCVTVTDTNGCSASACMTVFISTECGELFVPNAFSPNGDNENDKLCIYGTQCINTMTFVIYDRWGEKVFESTDPTLCWDGTYRGQQMNSAVFVYVLEGIAFSGDPISKKGNITLIR